MAAACCLAVGVSLWILGRGGEVARPAGQITAGWRIVPTGPAVFQIASPGLVRLQRGELFVESVPWGDAAHARPAIRIETPCGTATAAGTQFYIGIHAAVCAHRADSPAVRFEEKINVARSPHPTPSESKGTEMKSLTRVLVLAGAVVLANAQGNVTGGANHLLTAEAGKAPQSCAIAANSGFAFDLYRQLAKEYSGKNLFFSPYSMSGALAMAAEGARGETADQMGKVLRFPDAARRVGDDAQLIPWNVSLIHTGIASLNEQFNAAKTTAATLPKELHDKIDRVRKDLDAAKKRLAELEKREKEDENAPAAETQSERERARGEAQREDESAVPSDLIMSKGQEDPQYATAKKIDALGKQLHALLSQVNQYELHVANALWAEKTFPIQQSYLDTIRTYYATGGAFSVDFRNDAEPARRQINAWVVKQTADRIRELIPEEGVNAATRLLLTNAIYFKGEWAETFDETQTNREAFLLAGGGRASVSMMRHGNLGSVRYAAFNGDGTLFNTPREYRLGRKAPAVLSR